MPIPSSVCPDPVASRRLRRSAAFTLLEVMVATAVLGVATTSYLGALFSAQQMQQRNLARGRVMEAVQSVIEEAQAMTGDGVRLYYTANPTFAVAGVQPLLKWSWEGTRWETPRTTGPALQVGSITVGTATGTNRVPVTIICAWEDMQGPNVQTVNFIHTDRN